MKQVKTLSIFLTLLSVFTSCQENKKSSLTILSDQIPTVTPTIFGEGIISTDNYLEGSITFSPEMSELFFTRRNLEGKSAKIYTMKLIDGKWSKPELALFSKEYLSADPRINPKGDLLYFRSTRPLKDATESSGYHQWYIKKNAGGWGQPIPLEKPFVDRIIISCITSSENGNLYFTSLEKGAKPKDMGIYYSINQKGHYATIERMGKEKKNSGTWTGNPYIAPDESYMIYNSVRTSGFGQADLYIRFNKNGSWTESYNLGPKVNTKEGDAIATVSPDGKYLFFSRSGVNNGDIYWIDFIQLKKELLDNINSN